jgi:hypothetical protein
MSEVIPQAVTVNPANGILMGALLQQLTQG